MVKGVICWIVDNGFKVTTAEIVSVSGNLVLIKTENGKALKLPMHRLYISEEKAKEALQEHKLAQEKKTPYDYMG